MIETALSELERAGVLEPPGGVLAAGYGKNDAIEALCGHGIPTLVAPDAHRLPGAQLRRVLERAGRARDPVLRAFVAHRAAHRLAPVGELTGHRHRVRLRPVLLVCRPEREPPIL